MSASAAKTPSEAETPIGEVTLAGFAAVNAAVAEGFTLVDVLAIEGIPKQAWDRANLTWKSRVTEDAELFRQYEEELGQAEDFLQREVSPIGQDLAAWLAFLDVVADREKAFALLDRAGLTLNDVARLRRSWARKFAGDPKLEKQVVELRKKPLPALPRIDAKPALLRPSKQRKTHVSSPTSIATSERNALDGLDIAAFGLDRFAALIAELPVKVQDQGHVLRRYGLASEGELILLRKSFESATAQNVEMQADYRRLLAHNQARLRNNDSRAGLRDVPVPAIEPSAVDMASTREPAAKELPSFLIGASKERDARLPSLPRDRAPLDINATSDVLPVIVVEPLPFVSTPSPAFAAAMKAPSAPKPRVATRDARDETAALPAIRDDKPSLPFKGPLAPQQRPASPSRSPSRDARDETMAVPAILDSKPTLPFKKLEGPPLRDRLESSPKVVVKRVPKSAVDETVAVRAIPSGPALPFVAAPVPKNDAPAGASTLTLEQYTSLCAELAAQIQARALVLKRYGFANEEAWKREETEWTLRLRKSEELTSKHKQLLASFLGYLQRNRPR